MRKESLDYGVRYTRGNFLNVVPVYPPGNEPNFKFELYNNRVRAKLPVATLTTSVDTVIREGMIRRSFNANLEIRPDVPFSQEELNDLPSDIATFMVRELGGNPQEEEFIIKVTCQFSDSSNVKRTNIISESWISGGIDFNTYNIFSNNALVMSSGY
ncbi:hypothetical protein [Desulfosporosinus meridiei]|uniref:Uncharacterized protein n=1 Tax=Desulfosporosinus meridiei (strain ATCC BAA-275 / DSM 13257 / KCTC 12902 / NCIMB 13706 / S10) TaxID=768704 RepID=J7IPA8_DESMD|nr:hypothetical protein [Desulfosporosinus meridiei]AFQ43677.1 hypothetical protein Desmer_1703 [Desulfosporosinus meridiei DSM 13257]